MTLAACDPSRHSRCVTECPNPRDDHRMLR